MSKKLFFSIVLTIMTIGSRGAELFHFDFKGADGMRELASGEYTLRSRQVPLLVQKDALRVAPTAEIEILGPLPDLRSAFTVTAWILKKRDIDVCPILSRGGYGGLQQFVFTAGPELFTREGRWDCQGLSTGNWLKLSAQWKHITGIFSQGEYRVYVDGLPFATAKRKLPLLPAQDSPLIVGAEKNELASMNYVNADMLLNDLRLYSHALSDSEVAHLYASERARYPEGKLTPEGTHPRHGLEVCLHYAPGDPDFRHELELTRHWHPDPPPIAPIKAEMRCEQNAAARLFINGSEYFPYALYLIKYINHDRYELAQSLGAAKDFGAAGVQLCRIAAQARHPYMGEQWVDDGKYDFRYLDEKVQAAMQGNPAVWLDLTFGLSEAPPWFIARYPDELEKKLMPDGTLANANAGGELGSDAWKGCTERYLQAAFEHVLKSPYADRVFSFTVSGGRSSEWYWPGTFTPGIPGYSTATRDLYRKYLKRIGVEGAEMAEVPSPEARQASETLLLRDPQQAVGPIRFRRFLNERTFECMRDAILLAKKAGGGKRLVGTYAGYSFGNQAKHHISGMNVFGRIIRLPELDYTQLALTYGPRRFPGKSGLCVNPYNGSSMLHGKQLLYECDLRSPLYTNEVPSDWANRHDSIAEMVSVIERDAAMALTRGDGLYEMLLTGLASYHDEEIMQAVKRNADLARRALGAPRRSVAEVAVIYDEDSDNYFAWPNRRNAPFFEQLTLNFYQESPRAGLPVDFYTLEDMADSRMRPYKIYVFLNAIAVSPEMRAAILQKLDAEKATAVWCYAPGFISNERFDITAMEALTGIPFEVSLESASLSLKAAPASPFARYAESLMPLEYGPVFTPVGEGITIHATADGRPALVEKQHFSHTSIYTLAPLTPEFLRAAAKRCGAHIWLETEDVFSANQRFILVHASVAGEKRLLLPGVYDVLEAHSGEELYRGVSQFTVTLPQFANGVYELREHRQE